MKLFVLVAVALSAAFHAPAQMPQNRPDPAIQKLAFMVGEWEGEGWIEMPGQPRGNFFGSEKVAFKAGGNVLQVEGLHSIKLPDGKEMIVHDAMAVVTSHEDGYRFQSWLANGLSGDYRGELKDGAFVWGMENPYQGKVRYTIRRNEAGEWVETGEASKDGGPWKQFFEMTMRRK